MSDPMSPTRDEGREDAKRKAAARKAKEFYKEQDTRHAAHAADAEAREPAPDLAFQGRYITEAPNQNLPGGKDAVFGTDKRQFPRTESGGINPLWKGAAPLETPGGLLHDSAGESTPHATPTNNPSKRGSSAGLVGGGDLKGGHLWEGHQGLTWERRPSTGRVISERGTEVEGEEEWGEEEGGGEEEEDLRDAADRLDPGEVTAQDVTKRLACLPLFAEVGTSGAGLVTIGETAGGISGERREVAKSRALDHALALNGWNPRTPAEPLDQLAVRIEAQRRAAARDAMAFYEDRGEARERERSFDGLAHHVAVQQARVRPWDRFSKRALEQAGVDPELGRRAAREYEPHLFDDPAALVALEDTWRTQAAVKAKGADLIKEGWLTVHAAKRWMELRSNQGLTWRAAPHAPLLASLPFSHMSSVDRGVHSPTAGLYLSISRRPLRSAPKMGGGDFPPPPWGGGGYGDPAPQPTVFRADTEVDATGWIRAIRSALTHFQVESGDGRTEEVDMILNSGIEIIMLPPVDGNTGEHLVEYQVKVGHTVQQGQAVALISREDGEAYAYRAPFVGTVRELYFPRIDGRTGFPYIKENSRFLKIEREANWQAVTRYLPFPGSPKPPPPFFPHAMDTIDIYDEALEIGKRRPNDPHGASHRGGGAGAGGAYTRLVQRVIAPPAEAEGFWTSMRRVGGPLGGSAGEAAWLSASRAAQEWGAGRGGGDESSVPRWAALDQEASMKGRSFGSTTGPAHFGSARPASGLAWDRPASGARDRGGAGAHNHTLATLGSRYSSSALAAAAAILDA